MRLDQIQIPAVALLGLHLSTAQQQLLASTPSILLMLDADSAGRTATQRLRQQLAPTSQVRVASLPDGYDPDELTDDELHRCLKDGSADSE